MTALSKLELLIRVSIEEEKVFLRTERLSMLHFQI